MPEVLNESDAEKLIRFLLARSKEPLTTREIERTVQGTGKQCPDSAVRFLSKMRYKGMIKGEISIDNKGWIWWIENRG
jgi:hypothetical protein